YWVGAMVECKNQGGRLPKASELANIAKAIYNDNSISESEDHNNTDPTANEWDKSVTAKLGIEDSASWFRLWSNFEEGETVSWSRMFGPSVTYFDYTGMDARTNLYEKVICVAN
ncbi:hypothetical protein IJ579_00885, partial [bacterium]|nr:hypothetical protein [bacterium]